MYMNTFVELVVRFIWDTHKKSEKHYWVNKIAIDTGDK